MRPSPVRFALRSRSFGIFAAGNLSSQTGEWMTWVALNWAVLELTGSALSLGIINACRLVPAFVLSVPAGILADRMDRRKLLVWLQFGTAISTVWVGYLIASGSKFWLLAVIVTLRSVFMAAVTPVRNALVPDLVSREQVSSAVALDGTVRNLARIAGPAIAGVLIASSGAASVFWVSSFSIAAALVSLVVVRPRKGVDFVSGSAGSNLREAASYIKEDPSLLSLLILAVAPLMFAFPYTAMMPLFAGDLLRIGPGGLGLILSVAAVGALAGSMFLSFGGEVEHTGRWLVISIIGLGGFLVIFMFTQTLAAAAGAIFLVGLTSSTYRTTSRIAIQTRVPDRLRGRVMSIALMDRGLMPLGAILTGIVAELTGTLSAGIFMGGGCIVVTVAVLLARRQVWNL